jgi:alkanesulfonate monooxygenase SsuD/methylene tetrahydromethanopterin reductase-like flavin-dependent oxidoreductase (luciferase family)
LDALVAIADLLGRGRAPAIQHGRRGRGVGRGWSVFPGPSLRPPACFAFSSDAAVGAKTSRIEIGTAVIDMRYENPLYMAEDAGAADLIAGRRLQLGISRGSPEQVIDGWRYFGYQPADGQTDVDMGRRHAEVFLDLLRGEGFARPCFQIRPGCCA